MRVDIHQKILTYVQVIITRIKKTFFLSKSVWAQADSARAAKAAEEARLASEEVLRVQRAEEARVAQEALETAPTQCWDQQSKFQVKTSRH